MTIAVTRRVAPIGFSWWSICLFKLIIGLLCCNYGAFWKGIKKAFGSDFMAKCPMHEIFKRGVAPSETAQISPAIFPLSIYSGTQSVPGRSLGNNFVRETTYCMRECRGRGANCIQYQVLLYVVVASSLIIIPDWIQSRNLTLVSITYSV